MIIDPWSLRRGPTGPSPWTEIKIKILKNMWGNGHSASQIATKLGSHFTRNAVIGKAHRLKLHKRNPPVGLKSMKALDSLSKMSLEDLSDDKIDSVVDALLTVKGARRKHEV